VVSKQTTNEALLCLTWHVQQGQRPLTSLSSNVPNTSIQREVNDPRETLRRKPCVQAHLLPEDCFGNYQELG
jgi:hypothetical protein